MQLKIFSYVSLARLGLCLALFSSLSCAGTPSPRITEEVLRQKVDSESGGKLNLVSSKKTDGRKLEWARVQGYKLDYEAEIKFEADGT